MNAAVLIVIRYHGPASDNPNQLYWQTHTLLGGCQSGANAEDFGQGVGVQCPDFQMAIFNPPGR